MTQCTEPVPVGRSTPHASLAILGVKLRQLDFWAPVRKLVRIPQKTVKYAPADKLAAIFVTVLTGAHGLVESETRLRPVTTGSRFANGVRVGRLPRAVRPPRYVERLYRPECPGATSRRAATFPATQSGLPPSV